MALVSSLDRDMRKLRLAKYTPQAANEARSWIEESLGEKLQEGDLLEALKDGTALCRLANMAGNNVRFKESSMPFVQMENISHFLRACQGPPLNLHSHDIFQTVALYESKDPAQVLQCIAAFSRAAHNARPDRFPSMIGEKGRAGSMTPQGAGSLSGGSPQYGRARGASGSTDTMSVASSQPTSNTGQSARASPYTSPSARLNGSSSGSGSVSSWSRKADEGATMPAWNIAQYGYMGGASQGNQGITFGGRRQITTPAPKVPNIAEKERQRRKQEAEEQRKREAEEEEERRRRLEDEERARAEEEQRWQMETERQRERERQRILEEKRRWEEEEKRWKEEEEARAREEEEAERRLQAEKQRKHLSNPSETGSHSRLTESRNSQQLDTSLTKGGADDLTERRRIEDLERQLSEAKAREAQYERERSERLAGSDGGRVRSRSRPAATAAAADARARSRSKSRSSPMRVSTTTTETSSGNSPTPRQHSPTRQSPTRPLPMPQSPFQTGRFAPPSPSPSPSPSALDSSNPVESPTSPSPTATPLSLRPLPNPSTYSHGRSGSASPTRRSPFARPISSPAPPESPVTPTAGSSSPDRTASSPIESSHLHVTSSYRAPVSSTPIIEPEKQSPTRSQQHQSSANAPITNPLKKPPFANPSAMLSREMELDRQRQVEWEQAQLQSMSHQSHQNPSQTSRPGSPRRPLLGPRAPPGAH